MKKQIAIHILITIVHSFRLLCMDLSFPYNKEDLQQYPNKAYQTSHLKDPYVVDGEYWQNTKNMWFYRNQLCKLKAKIPTPDGIKHIVLPIGTVYATVHKLQKLTDEEFTTVSNFEREITKRSFLNQYRGAIFFDKYKEIASRVRTIIHSVEIDNRDIMRYILFSLQGDKHANPIHTFSIDEEAAKRWESRLPKHHYEEHKNYIKKLKETIRKQIEQEIKSDAQKQLSNEKQKSSKHSTKQTKKHKRHSGSKQKQTKQKLSTQTNSARSRSPSPNKRKKNIITTLVIPKSPRHTRSNSVDDPTASSAQREKVTPRERRSHTEGNMSSRTHAILQDMIDATKTQSED